VAVELVGALLIGLMADVLTALWLPDLDVPWAGALCICVIHLLAHLHVGMSRRRSTLGPQLFGASSNGACVDICMRLRCPWVHRRRLCWLCGRRQGLPPTEATAAARQLRGRAGGARLRQRRGNPPEPEAPRGPMAGFDEAAVLAWLGAVPGLSSRGP
jgi:hypothetical protein